MTSPTGNSIIDSILWGGSSWDGNRITYFFSERFFDWSNKEKDAYRTALKAWSNVADIEFVEVSRRSEANFVEHVVNNRFFGEPGVNGSHDTPDDADSQGGRAKGYYNYEEYGAPAGQSYVTRALEPGGFAYSVMLHEVGHGLGLAHPHDRGGGSNKMPGVSRTFGDYGDNDLNQGLYTIMSYNDGWDDVQSPYDNKRLSYGYSKGPGALDIAAIQHLYGANLNHKSGDSTYEIIEKGSWMSIWDTGGTDTIKYAGDGDVVINLNSATLDNSPTGGGMPSYTKNGHGKKYYGGFTIAGDFTDALPDEGAETGVIIENARGKAGDDKLVGNGVDNVLEGRGGKDSLAGNEGSDTLIGGYGKDKLNGQKGKDEIIGGPGQDTLRGGANKDNFVFVSHVDSRRGPLNRDTIEDFQKNLDQIDLSQVDARAGPGNQAFTFIGTSDYSGSSGELRFEKMTNGTLIQADRNGDGQVDMAIVLDGRMTLQASDFIL